MSEENCGHKIFNELTNQFSSFNNTIVALYHLKTDKMDAINEIHLRIEEDILETNLLSPDDILLVIMEAMKCNMRYSWSYYTIYKKYVNHTRIIILRQHLLHTSKNCNLIMKLYVSMMKTQYTEQ